AHDAVPLHLPDELLELDVKREVVVDRAGSGEVEDRLRPRLVLARRTQHLIEREEMLLRFLALFEAREDPRFIGATKLNERFAATEIARAPIHRQGFVEPSERDQRVDVRAHHLVFAIRAADPDELAPLLVDELERIVGTPRIEQRRRVLARDAREA